MVDERSAMRYDNSNDNPTLVRAMTIGDVLNVHAIDIKQLDCLLDMYRDTNGHKHTPSIETVRFLMLAIAARHHDHKRKDGNYCDSTLGQLQRDIGVGARDALAFLESIGVLTTIKRGGRNRAPHRRLNTEMIALNYACVSTHDKERYLCGHSGGRKLLDRVNTPSESGALAHTSKSISNTTNAKNDAATACASSLPANNPYAINNINNGDTQ
jgi:hypothetical protein